MDTTELTEIDLTDTDIYRNGFPHEVFTTLRSEQPVSWHQYPDDYPGPHDPGFWAITKYADVQAANRDPELFSAYDGPALALQPQTSGLMLVTMDGRDHARQRKLISKGFTPRMVARLDEQARARAITIVEEARERGTCDFVRDVAYKLPMHMIADIVGIPLEDREHVFTIATQFLLGALGGYSEADHLAVQIAMFEYAQELGRRKRSEPEDDVWTILSTVEIETDDGERTTLSESELDLFFMLLTIAGSETTRNAISLGMLTLLDHRDQLEVMRTQPDAMRGAVEEILRWSSPVSYFARRATRDTEVRGVPIAAGDRVTLWYPSANRDEDAFDLPFNFDIGRNPNPHISFGGGGPHYCLGANLARREITILFEELLARTQEIEVVAPATYARIGIYSPVFVALEAMPVRLS